MTASVDNLRTGWDAAEPGLAPASVSASDFGQLFATQLDGQVYAQPVVGKGIVFAATENDKIYGLNPATGAVVWQRDVGPYWPASAIGCGDLVPNIGITSTPAYDPATGTVYFTAKVNDGPDSAHPRWTMHAVDITTGAERAGFPTTIGGSPSNDPNRPFNAKTAAQRPGLLLLNGVVYAGFASYCDYGPYVGYVVGVNASSGKQTALWSAETGNATGAGIWQSGGGLVSDGAGRIFFATGNGLSPSPAPGTSPPSGLAESVVRLGVAADGSLSAKDFFSPVNNTNLDTDDTDLGAGGPMALPDGYGTSAHPHVMVQVGKDGRVFLLDRDALGGTKQGAGGTDAVLQTAGPYNGVWGHPAFWGGDGGYVYLVENSGYLRAYKVGVSGSGLPSLTSVGTSNSTWGYTSGSPTVTSSGTTSGSALVWAVYAGGSNGANGQLRAYDATPTNGILKLRYSAPIGTAAKFATPATDGGRVYVGTRDGKLYGFGRPAAAALSGTPTDFGSVGVGTSATKTVTVTATTATTVSAVSATAPFSTGAVTLPKTLAAGQTLSVPVTFAPSAAGAASGPLTFTLSQGTVQFDLHGSGTVPGLGATPASLDFGQVPTSGKVTQNVNVTNTGTQTVSITAATGPAAPFSTTGLPAVNSTLAPGASVSIPVTFAPTSPGTYSSKVTVTSNQGGVSIPVTGTSASGSPQLTLSPTTVDFGPVAVGSTASRTFDISNTGNLLLTLSKAAPPAAPFGTTTPISEGQQLEPGDVIHQSLSFTPGAVGEFSGTYLITGNDGRGAQSVTVTGTGVPAQSVAVPAPAAGGWTANGSATQSGGDTVLTTTAANQAGDVVYPTPVRTNGLHVTFTAQLGGGTGGDGMTFTMLDPAQATARSLGKTGGALGYGGLPGLAVTLDTFKNGSDPSGNFVGVALGASGPNSDVMTYLATRDAPTSLRTGTHVVDVVLTSTGLTVRLDGGAPLVVKGNVPARALLAFTAGTGTLTDTHTVRNVTITQPAATGQVVGLAGKCLTAADASGAAGTAAVLATCGGTSTQLWTAGGDNTLHALGNCLDVNGGATAAGTSVQLWTCNGTGAQVWQSRADGSLLNPQSGRCLDVKGGVSTDGTRLQLWDCNGTAAQKWNLPS